MRKKLLYFLLTLLTISEINAQIVEENFDSESTVFTLNDNWIIDSEIFKNGTQAIKNPYETGNTTHILELTNSIDISAVESPVLSFWQIAKTEGGYDKCYVEVSTDGGENYQTLTSTEYLGGNQNFIDNGYFHEDSYVEWGTNDESVDNTMWKKEYFSLENYKGADVKIRFKSTTDFSGSREGWYIDAINIENKTCFFPTTIEASEITGNSIKINWNDSEASSYIVEYGLAGFTLGEGMQEITSDLFFTAPNLEGSTDYDFYVKSVCSDSEESDFSNKILVRTACSTVTYLDLPYSNSFEDLPSLGSDKVGECLESTGDWVSSNQESFYNRQPRTGENYIYTDYTADDWIVTPYLNFEENKTYRFSFWYISDGSGAWTVSIKKGEATDYTTWTEVISTNEVNAEEYTKIEGEFTITNDTDFRLGIHVEADNSPWYISIDDLLIEEVNTSTPCALPTTVSVSEITETTAKISWENTTNVEILYGVSGFDHTTSGTTVTATSSDKVLENLVSNTSYDVYVRNVCGADDKSDWTAISTFTTLAETIPCELPTAVAVSEITETTAKISWENTTNVEILYGVSGFDHTTSGTTVTATSSDKVLENLVSNTSYDVYVRNVCGADDKSDWTAVSTFTTLEETILCEIPTEVEVEDVESTSVKVKWESDLENFEILYGVSGFDILSEGTTISVEEEDDYELENLSGNTAYDVYVRSVCSDENKSEWTTKVSFTTEENLSVNTLNKDEISVYPNPVNDFFFIKSNAKVEKMELVNSLGKVVLVEKNQTPKVEMKNIEKGIYFINIYTISGKKTIKILKK
ncbi:fibronectin type III domain-containing protein [Aureivirga sp. CE67]|uniref:fibronectin type III domain-containing protein n=1 Tax=Aureivirga sp. CE67 TaxID=1788983 RepID=UPI0018C8DC34|nr:T9SS type A sorting domain-containing protein [Aureivirga sp. CE67]